MEEVVTFSFWFTRKGHPLKYDVPASVGRLNLTHSGVPGELGLAKSLLQPFRLETRCELFHLSLCEARGL